jgi:3-oxoacyl-[acyl-carrier-protein] synthase II
MKRVVITGIGSVSALGNNITEMFESLEKGKNGIGKISLISDEYLSKMKVSVAAEVKIDLLDHFSKRELKYTDRFSAFGIISAREAFKDANFKDGDFDQNRFAVIVSAGLGGSKSIEDGVIKIEKSGRTSPFFIPMIIPNMVAGLISMDLKLKGHCSGTVSACSSSAHSIMEGCRLIKLGEADKVLVGGAESTVSRMGITGFDSMTALSRSSDPDRASIPFDKERSGFVMGEGAASLILEDYDSAVKRGAQIYAEVVGYGSTADAEHITSPAEDGEGMVRAIEEALKMAKIEAKDIDYVNAHGTSTPINDKTETIVFKTVFGENAHDVSISSTKSMHGHTLGAAGAIESVACVFAINKGIIPPTINYKVKDEECDLNYTPNVSKKKNVNYTLKTSLGFGGHNAAIILGKVE